MSTRSDSLSMLLKRVRECQHCAAELPHDPRPVLRLSKLSKVVIVGQAPGAKVHASGIPWQDDSGDHLREWLNVSDNEFANANNFGILPMSFCWPGRRTGGDLPPRPECAPLWHPSILEQLPRRALILLVGSYAVAHYLPGRKKTLTETVRAFDSYLPQFLPLPHPSWRSKHWIKKNPWFASDVVPELRRQVRQKIGNSCQVNDHKAT